MEKTKVRPAGYSRARSIAFTGLTIALMAVSAWVTIPIGAVPVTLQMFAVTFAIVVLSPKEAIAAITGYLLLGAVGVPVFAGMRGGVGVLAGPTGGFLWGYLFGVAAAVLLLHVARTRWGWGIDKPQGSASCDGGDVVEESASAVRRFGRFVRAAGVEIAAGVLFTAISYLCGWAQYMAVAGVGPVAALLVCVAPFVVIDLVKILAAVACARAVKAVVR